MTAPAAAGGGAADSRDATADGRAGRGEAVLIVSRVVRAGCEDRFRAWCDRVSADAEAAAGHRGELRLEQSGGLFHAVHRFADAGALAAWEAGGGYAGLMAEGDRFSTSRRQAAAGPRPAAVLPAEADGAKWKRFLVTWAAVLPVVLVLNAALDTAAPVLRGGGVTGPARTVLTSMVMVATMTWAILPRVSRWVKPWVMRGGDGRARAAGDG